MGCKSCKLQEDAVNENFVCYLCFSNIPEYMHYPCCHYGICQTCKNDIIDVNTKGSKKCPICNQKSTLKKIYYQGEIEITNNLKIRENVISEIRNSNKELIEINKKLIDFNKYLRNDIIKQKKINEALNKKIKNSDENVISDTYIHINRNDSTFLNFLKNNNKISELENIGPFVRD